MKKPIPSPQSFLRSCPLLCIVHLLIDYKKSLNLWSDFFFPLLSFGNIQCTYQHWHSDQPVLVLAIEEYDKAHGIPYLEHQSFHHILFIGGELRGENVEG